MRESFYFQIKPTCRTPPIRDRGGRRKTRYYKGELDTVPGRYPWHAPRTLILCALDKDFVRDQAWIPRYAASPSKDGLSARVKAICGEYWHFQTKIIGVYSTGVPSSGVLGGGEGKPGSEFREKGPSFSAWSVLAQLRE